MWMPRDALSCMSMSVSRRSAPCLSASSRKRSMRRSDDAASAAGVADQGSALEGSQCTAKAKRATLWPLHGMSWGPGQWRHTTKPHSGKRRVVAATWQGRGAAPRTGGGTQGLGQNDEREAEDVEERERRERDGALEARLGELVAREDDEGAEGRRGEDEADVDGLVDDVGDRELGLALPDSLDLVLEEALPGVVLDKLHCGQDLLEDAAPARPRRLQGPSPTRAAHPPPCLPDHHEWQKTREIRSPTCQEDARVVQDAAKLQSH